MMNVNSDNKTWPMLLDMTKDECKKTLRSLELSAYGNIISVFRAQGELTKEKRKLLSDLQSIFAISVERHRAEIRRAVNDERLNTIAETLAGPNTNIEWTIEGRRLIPLMPRAPPQVAYTALATRMAQLYCGINSQLPNPCDTALYGKLDDLGADKEATDSEDETEGLRYITDSMIPQQYNADQGAYTTLPISESRLTKEKLKEKKENIEDLNHEVPPSSPLNPSSISSGSNASPCSQTKPHVVVGSEKRKRKRSLSTDHPPPHSPPPPPVPTLSQAPSSSNGVQSGGQTQSASTAIRQVPNIGPSLGGCSMKITVTGGMTRSSSATSTNSSAQQKVILVSTSAASGTVGNIYQRSISVPILKSTPQTSLTSLSGIPPILGVQATSQSAILKSTVSTPSASVVGSSVMTKIRPRFSSSILSQGSSSLPGLPPRPPLRSRSNSLILQTEGESSGLTRSSSGPSFSQASSVISESSGPNSSCLNFIGATSLQLRPGSSLAPKSNLQVKQEGGKLIAHSMVPGASLGGSSISSSTLNSAGSGTGNVVGSRIIGRGSMPPSSSQGLYMVSTTSGTITVVTRTVASASISTPRVVTVNTINSSRPSIVRGPSSSSVMSVGMNPKAVSTMRQTGSIRPVISGPKSNVIVVHKGTIGPGARPVGLHGLRDLSTKIIKPSQQGLSGNISSNSGILSGTLVVKPSVSTKSLSSSSSTKEPCTVIGTSVSSSSGTTTTVSSSGNNLIVVDLNCESASGAQSSTSAVSNTLPTPGTSSTVTRNVNSLFACTGRNLSEATSTLQKRESSSHDISTVSASSSLPSTFRVIKTPSLPSDSEDTGFDLVESDLQQRTEDRMPISNQVTSSSDIKDSIDVPDEGGPMMGTKETAASSLSVEDHEDEEEEEEEEEDNEWLKLGLEDEEDPEMEDEDDRGSEVDCEIEKLATSAEESMENEADMVGDSPKAIDSASDEVTEGGKPSKAGTSGEASVSSSTGTGNEKEGDLQMLEKAVEVLQDGDSDQARSLLYNAGFELIDSSSDPDQGPSDGFSISNIAGVSSSSAAMGSGTPLSSSTPLRDESSLGSMSELDPATGYFYSPSAGENSSEPTSNKADSPTPRESDSVPEENQD